jgi:hypothetical protein
LFELVLSRDWQGAARLVGEAKLPADFPPALRPEFDGLGKEVRCLKALSELGVVINGSGKEPAEIVANLGKLGELSEDPELLTQLRQYSRCRFCLEGNAEAAAKVLPGGKAPADADGLLRDMKALRSGGDASKLPMGDSVLGLVPEPPALSFRPGVKEAYGADLPALESAEKEARLAVLVRMEESAEVHFAHVHVHLYHLTHGLHYVPGGTDRDRDEREKTAAEVEKVLGRNLTPAERVLVRHLQGKKSVEELAAILREAGNP